MAEAQTVTYRYGNYTHEVGEGTDFRVETRPSLTGRGYRDTVVVRMTLAGRFLACTWQEIAAKIDELLDAYIVSDQPFGLYHPDGTASRHVMDPTNPSLIVGPYLADLEFPTGTMEEYVMKRDWKVVMEGILLLPESQIVSYEESIQHLGTGGPIDRWQYTLGPPVQYRVWPWTTQVIAQRGKSVGLEGWYLPGWSGGQPFVYPSVAGGQPNTPIGLRVLGDEYEHFEQRYQVIGKPQRRGRVFLYHPAEWRYIFETPANMLLQPY